MPSTLRQLLTCLLLLTISGFKTDSQKVSIHLIGDSTMANKKVGAYPETGWGTPFQYFFDSSAVVVNYAKNGLSTKTFISGGYWNEAISKMNAGDYIIIQFGHNDEVKTKKSYSTPEEFKSNLTTFIEVARSRKVTPILLTPVSRRQFVDGIAQENHAEYAELMREVASALQVTLIDIDKQSLELLNALGEDKSKFMFLHLEPGEHPNYPEGKTDNTHFNELGARMIAQMVLKNIMSLELGLKQHVVKKASSK